jgi:PhnB protein
MPDVIPMLSYENGTAALDWLARVFGFIELERMVTPEGILAHGEMQAGDGIIMLATPSQDYQSPKKHREKCAAAKAWSVAPWIVDGVLVYVDDVDQHFTRAKTEGAAILSGLEDGPPGRRYRAEDFEGHRWMFMERE